MIEFSQAVAPKHPVFHAVSANMILPVRRIIAAVVVTLLFFTFVAATACRAAESMGGGLPTTAAEADVAPASPLARL